MENRNTLVDTKEADIKKILKNNEISFILFILFLFPALWYLVIAALGNVSFLGYLTNIHMILLVSIPMIYFLTKSNLSTSGRKVLLVASKIIKFYLIIYLLGFLLWMFIGEKIL